MHRATIIVLCGLAAAGPAGCGGGYAPTGLTTAPAPSRATPAVAPPVGGTSRLVTIRNLAFTPRTITTRVGRPVEWANRDGVPHNITTRDGATIASPDLAPGAHFVYVPVRPARVRYYCTIHPSTMSGVLIVKA